MKRTLHTADIWLGGRRAGPHRLVADRGRWTSVQPIDGAAGYDGQLLVAGLVDLHVHAGIGPFAADVEDIRATGVTLACAQGDAGWRNFAEWERAVDAAPVDIRLALNLNPHGEAGGDGSLARVTERDVGRTIAVGQANRRLVRMVAVNLSERSLGPGPVLATLDLASEVAVALGLPMLVGLASPERADFGAQLARLRAGDVVTYGYRATPWTLIPDDVEPALVDARARGVVLDVTHGRSAFADEVARRAIARGHPPSTISSDLQVATTEPPPPVGLPDVIDRLGRAGLPVADALRACTSHAAAVLGVDGGQRPDFRVGEAAIAFDLPSRRWISA